MPRPHIPHHISLQRIKSSNNTNGYSNPSSAPSTPPTNSRSGSPTRGYMATTPGTQPKSPSEGRTGDHKGMGLVLRVHVLKARNLAPKDKSGTSDPYLVLTLGDAREATSVVTKTLNPEWNQTFEFPVASADAALLEAICWDKDRFKKDYMGEFDVVLEDLFLYGNTQTDPKWVSLESRRAGKKKKKDQNVSGEVLLQFSLYDPMNTAATSQQLLQKFVGVVGEDDDADDTDDELNRITSRDLDDVDEEDDEDKEPSDETDDGLRTPGGGTPDDKQRRKRQKKIQKLRRKNKLKAYEFSGMSDVAGVLFLEINRITDLPPEKNSTRTTFDMDPFVVTSLGKKTYRTKVINHNLNPVFDEKLVFQVQKHEVNYSIGFAVVDRDKFSGNDFVGTVNFPVDKVKNLAPEADPETGLYRLPDPHLESSEGIAETQEREKKKRFRIPLSRSASSNSLSRTTSQNNLSKLTRTASSDSLKGEQTNTSQRPGMKRLESENEVTRQLSHRPAPTSAPSYASTKSMQDIDHTQTQNGSQNDDPALVSYELPLALKNKARWQDKHNPVLYIKAKYLPYRALRQQFWRAMLKQYDADDSGTLEKVELITMLDTLGSTLHNSTIDGFFKRWQAVNGGGKFLTMDQAVICLEEQLMKSRETQSSMHRPDWHRGESLKSTHTAPGGLESSPDESPGGTTPYLGGVEMQLGASGKEGLTPNSQIPALEVSEYTPQSEKSPGGEGGLGPTFSRSDSWGAESEADLNDDPSTQEEHVVEIHECPICHMPRLSTGGKKKGGATDADIITHIATCASSDWRAVNNLVMAGFVTSSQAQRKWYDQPVLKLRVTLLMIWPGTPKSSVRSPTVATVLERIARISLCKTALRV